jgi:hypothetical protein
MTAATVMVRGEGGYNQEELIYRLNNRHKIALSRLPAFNMLEAAFLCTLPARG